MFSENLHLVSIPDLVALNLGQPGCLLAPWLPEWGLALIHGPRGVGKSYLALGIARAVAIGGGFSALGGAGGAAGAVAAGVVAGNTEFFRPLG